MIIAIPIKPYLKDFILRECGSEPVATSLKNMVGVLLEPLLQKPPMDHVHHVDYSDTSLLVVDVKQHKRDCGCTKNPLCYWYLNKDNNNRFQNGISEIFWHTCYSYLDAKLEDGKGEIKDNIYKFCYKYRLEHANYELIKKSYYRYKLSK